MRRQTLYLITPAVVLALTLSVVAVISVTGQDTDLITDKLRELHDKLEGEKPALQNKVNGVIHQIRAGAFNGALNKLQNDVRDSIIAWVEDPEELLHLIDEIIDLIKGITPPPPEDFTISASPATLAIQQGRSNTSIITLTSISGFDDQVNLTITSTSITGVDVAVNPREVILRPDAYAISVLTVDVVSDAALGTFNITVTGTSGVLQRSAKVTLTVTESPVSAEPDFSLNVYPTSLKIEQGDTRVSTIVATSLRGFSGIITLTIISEPISGATLSLDPTQITLSPHDLATSTLTIGVAGDATLREHEITITGKDGGLQRSTIISLEIMLETKPPKILSVSRLPENAPAYNQTVTVIANVEDLESGIASVTLSYSAGTLQKETAMTLEAGLYKATIAVFAYNEAVEYQVIASDNVGNHAASSTLSYTVADPYPPLIGNPTWSPQEPMPNEDIKVNVTVTEPEHASGIKQVILQYSNETTTAFTPMTDNHDGNWTAVISNQTSPRVTFLVKAIDHAGNTVESQAQEINMTAPAFPLAWILAAIVILAAATGGGAYYVNRKRKQGEAPAT